MPEVLLPLVPALPALTATVIGLGVLSGAMAGEARERATACLALTGIGGAFLLSLLVLGLRWAGTLPAQVHLGDWLRSGGYRVGFDFSGDGLSLGLLTLFALLCFIVTRFSINYLHRDAGYHRFFFVLNLFSAAMLLLVAAGNGVLAFMGWEVAGACSYLLIAYAYDRANASANATRAFVTNRVGDAGFVLGLFLSWNWLGSLDWTTVAAGAAALGSGQQLALAACFLLAAAAKSAQVPLAPWLARAMEGPTPSSAVFYGSVMVHAGVYLVLRLEPLFESSPAAMGLLVATGGLTALYGFLAGLVQTDVKSALIFSTSGQVGLMFLACGLGWWDLAAWHLGAHAVMRGYQFLTAPSYLHHGKGHRTRPVPAWLAGRVPLYTAALQRFWLEQATDWAVVRPVRTVARDVNRFEDKVLNPLIGLPAPAVRVLSSLAQWEERRIGAYDPADYAGVIRAPGLLGRLTQAAAALLHRFEEYWVLQGLGEGAVRQGRRLGPGLNRLEQFLAQPRNVVLLVIVTLLLAL